MPRCGYSLRSLDRRGRLDIIVCHRCFLWAADSAQSECRAMCVRAGRGNASSPRLLCVLGARAQAEIVEEFVGPSAGVGETATLTNAVTELRLGEGSQLRHG